MLSVVYVHGHCFREVHLSNQAPYIEKLTFSLLGSTIRIFTIFSPTRRERVQPPIVAYKDILERGCFKFTLSIYDDAMPDTALPLLRNSS